MIEQNDEMEQIEMESGLFTLKLIAIIIVAIQAGLTALVIIKILEML